MIRHRRRGSSLFFVIAMILAMTVVVMTSAEMSMAAERAYIRALDQAQADVIFSSMRETVESGCENQTETPGSKTINLNGKNYPYTVTDTDSIEPRTYQINASTIVNKKTYTYEERIPARQPAHFVYYAAFSGANLNTNSSALTTISDDNNAAVHANGNIQINNKCSIGGDITGKTVDNQSINTHKIESGKSVSSGLLTTITNLINVQYLLFATESSLLGATLNSGKTFSTVSGSNPYPVYYVLGNLNIKGTLRNRGTIVATGNINITGNIDYYNNDSRCLLLAGGSININNNVTSIAGTYFAVGTINVNSPSLTVTRGNLFTLGSLSLNKPVTINADRMFWRDRQEAVRHKVPGFWFLVDTPGLLR